MKNIKFRVGNIFIINDQKRADKRLKITNQTVGQTKGYLALWAVIKSRIELLSAKKNIYTVGIYFCIECKNWFYGRGHCELCQNCRKVKGMLKAIIRREKVFLQNCKGSPEKLKKRLKEREFRERLKIKTNGDKEEYLRLLFNHNMRKRYTKKKDNLEFKLSLRMSQMIYLSLKKNKKGKHWEDLVGYTLDELKEHLGKTMPKGYAWRDLFGRNKLHIDHIIPQRAFIFKSFNDEEFKMCWSLHNLRLLTANENVCKWAYFDNPLLLYLLIKYVKKTNDRIFIENNYKN